MTFFHACKAVENWTVRSPIYNSERAETYRVADPSNRLAVLKLFSPQWIEADEFGGSTWPLEPVIRESLNHPFIPCLIESGFHALTGREYIITDLVPGENLFDLMNREVVFAEPRARWLMMSLLEVVAYLHRLEDPVVHKSLEPGNVVVNAHTFEQERMIPVSFGCARRKSDGPAMSHLAVHPRYLPNECLERPTWCPATDVFSLGVILYMMLFIEPPWEDGFTDVARPGNWEAFKSARSQPVHVPDHTISGDIDPSLRNAIRKALSANPDDRFADAGAFLEALSEPSAESVTLVPADTSGQVDIQTDRPRGFAAVAGMSELKRILTEDFLNALRDPELYRRFGLSIPNGMLLFGPPGCGKTYIAERLGEELGFAFRKINPSTVASIYVHGTQEKIAQIFKAARSDAPCLLFIDELDALVPSRSGAIYHSYAAEVNEWLAQMSNCGEDGVFLLAATNQPQRIDKAALRAGRIDKVVYVGPPDHEARRAMFEVHLNHRPLDEHIDCNELAQLTEAHTAGDIRLLVDEAARDALTSGAHCIRMSHLLGAIKRQLPTVSPEGLAEFEDMRSEFESRRNSNRAVRINKLRTKWISPDGP